MSRLHSAGVLLFRTHDGITQVLLIKPGGPFWKNKDAGAWMIPKGAVEPGESAFDAAVREFEEETGARLTGKPVALANVRQSGGKVVEAFAVEGDFDPAEIASNEFEMEWPPKSGRRERFPEAVEARWLTLAEARAMMLPSQVPLLDALGATGEIFVGEGGNNSAIVLLPDESAVRSVRPDFAALATFDRLVIVTARGDEQDIASRVFAAYHGIDEDPVTGSAHAALAPYWAERLGRNEFTALQASARTGILHCRVEGDRVLLGGECQTVIVGQFQL